MNIDNNVPEKRSRGEVNPKTDNPVWIKTIVFLIPGRRTYTDKFKKDMQAGMYPFTTVESVRPGNKKVFLALNMGSVTAVALCKYYKLDQTVVCEPDGNGNIGYWFWKYENKFEWKREKGWCTLERELHERTGIITENDVFTQISGATGFHIPFSFRELNEYLNDTGHVCRRCQAMSQRKFSRRTPRLCV